MTNPSSLARSFSTFKVTNLFLGLSLGDVVAADLDPGLEEGLGELSDGQSHQVAGLLCDGVVGQGGLV